jgi:hypothetical protein
MTAVSASRGGLGWLSAGLGGAISAAAFVVAVTHSGTVLVFALYLAVLPLLLAGLGAGRASGILAALIGTVGVFFATGFVGLTLFYALAFSLPAAVFTALALRYRTNENGRIFWYPEGHLLTALTLYPCIIFIGLGLYVYLTGTEGGLLGLSQRVMERALLSLQEQIKSVSTKLDAETQATYAEGMQRLGIVRPRLARSLPAILGCSWLFFKMINVGVAQLTLRQQKWNVRDSFRLPDLRISPVMLFATAAAGLIGFLTPAPFDYMGLNLCYILCVPFFFVGLAVIHAYARTTRAPRSLLFVFYMALSIVLWMAVLVALLGAVDQKFNFRQRLTGLPTPSQKV